MVCQPSTRTGFYRCCITKANMMTPLKFHHSRVMDTLMSKTFYF
ncbi:hypothetical protein FKM82_010392 [Ascaphus truei]